MNYPFEVGKVYTFNTLSPTFLGAVIKRAKLESIVNSTVARTFDPIDQRHKSIYPTLPNGTPKDLEAYIFYLFKAENGSRLVMADKWIDEESIELIEHVSITVRLPNASLGDDVIIRNALNAAGVTDYAIEVT